MIIEGPIEAINGHIIVIYGIEIKFKLDDPILAVLQVGDIIRVNGSIVDTPDASIVVTHVETASVDSAVAISEDGQSVWRDSGGCDNPPPPWAPANGWRRRCEGQPNSSGRQNYPAQGQGQGRGNSDDDD